MLIVFHRVWGFFLQFFLSRVGDGPYSRLLVLRFPPSSSRGAVTDGVIDGDRVVAVAVALPFFGDLFVVRDVEVVDVDVDVVFFF